MGRTQTKKKKKERLFPIIASQQRPSVRTFSSYQTQNPKKKKKKKRCLAAEAKLSDCSSQKKKKKKKKKKVPCSLPRSGGEVVRLFIPKKKKKKKKRCLVHCLAAEAKLSDCSSYHCLASVGSFLSPMAEAKSNRHRPSKARHDPLCTTALASVASGGHDRAFFIALFYGQTPTQSIFSERSRSAHSFILKRKLPYLPNP